MAECFDAVIYLTRATAVVRCFLIVHKGDDTGRREEKDNPTMNVVLCCFFVLVTTSQTHKVCSADNLFMYVDFAYFLCFDVTSNQ